MRYQALTVVVDALAVFRLTRLVLADAILDAPRDWLMARDKRSRRQGRRLGWVVFLTCGWCVSMWIAAGVVAARMLLPTFWSPVALVLALSAIAAVLMAHEG